MDDDFLFACPTGQQDTFLAGRPDGTTSTLTLDQLADELVSFRGVIRTFGHPDNAFFIHTLYSIRSGSGVQFCTSGQLLAELPPHRQIQQLRHFSNTCSHGVHWLDVREDDAAALQLAVLARNGIRESAESRLSQHPAWPVLSFIPTKDRGALCSLLGLIGDIRFFTHPTKPRRLSRLLNYLGVRPHVMEEAGTVTAGRLATTIKAWAGDANGPTRQRLSLPSRGHFLSRVYAAAETREAGLLQATRLFVQLLYAGWTGYRRAGKFVRFTPDLFFRSNRDAAEYRSHLQENFPGIALVDWPVGQH